VFGGTLLNQSVAERFVTSTNDQVMLFVGCFLSLLLILFGV